MTVGELANWIVRYRRGNAFKGYSVAKIIEEIDTCISEGSFIVANKSGNIVAVAFGKKDTATMTMHVYDILTINKSSIKSLVLSFLKTWPDYKITGNRRGRIVEFDLNTLKRIAYGK